MTRTERIEEIKEELYQLDEDLFNTQDQDELNELYAMKETLEREMEILTC